MMHGDVTAFFQVILEGIAQSRFDEAISELPPVYESVRKLTVRMSRLGMKLVLLLDEFDAVTRNPNFGVEFFSFLRSLPNNYLVSYIVTSAQELQGICHSKEIAGSPFFNIFHKLNLTPFVDAEAIELVTKPSRESGVPLETWQNQIISVAGRFPLF